MSNSPNKYKKQYSEITKEYLLSMVVQNEKTGCWNWKGGKAKGYGRVWDGSKFKSFQAHVVSFRLWRGEIPSGYFVCHKCDIRACINPEHLFVGTQSDNMRDASAKGRVVIPNKKLTREQVIEIRNSPLGLHKLFQTGKYPIGWRGIAKVRSGATYASIV